MTQPTEQPHVMIVECPNCDGDGGHIDDDNPNGWQVCSYCGGKAIVNYSETEEWQDWDENIGFDVM